MPDDNVSMSMPDGATGAPSLPTVAAPTDGAMAAGGMTGAGMMPAGGAGVGVPTDGAAGGTMAGDPAQGVSTAMPGPSVDAAAVNPAAEAAPAVASDVVVNPTVNEPAAVSAGADTEILTEVAHKISDSHNVLVALSSDPSVDEMAAAIGLSLFLDKLGKRATAIYSGATPNALEFLKPEETFEPSVDSLQDFVIALNKEKADHLRYKLDGDFVKIYITPYRSRIAEEDLEFSYGDYNVDLVLALDVANGVDLDAALREHGRIMHDAVIINITTSNPGKLGEIEWSDKNASSVSEMIAKLLYGVNTEVKIEKEEATAFLTGIVAATNRFSNSKTTPETMRLASRLMESGANQQLVSKNITPDVENEMFGAIGIEKKASSNEDPTKLDIQHGDEESTDESKTVSAKVTEKSSTLLDDLKAAEASLAAAGAETTPEKSNEPLKIDSDEVETPQEVMDEQNEAAGKSDDEMGSSEVVEKPEEKDESIGGESEEDTKTGGGVNIESEAGSETGDKSEAGEKSEGDEMVIKSEPGIGSESEAGDKPEAESESGAETDSKKEGESEPKKDDGIVSDKPEKVVQPINDMGAPTIPEGEEGKYSHMLEDALKSINEAASSMPPVVSGAADGGSNPAATGAPAVPSNPEINGVPEINYMPMPGDSVLPPPPTPPIDMDAPVPSATGSSDSGNGVGVLPSVEPIAPATPTSESEPKPEPLGDQPAMQDQVYNSQAADPGAFKIPGM